MPLPQRPTPLYLQTDIIIIMLLALAYPELEKDDYEWIQGVRKKEDELYFDVVEPHFTLVFPGHSAENEELLAFVKSLLTDTKPIQFTVRGALVVKDSFNDYWHTFLVPDEGNSDIIQLHDRLYTGPLKKDLLLEIPFIPHIGIGSSKDSAKMKRLADKLNEDNISITGTISSVDLVDNDSIKTVESVKL